MRLPIRTKGARTRVSDGSTMPASTGGLDKMNALADMKPDRAIVLDNWIPRTGFLEVRRGFRFYAHTGGTDEVESLMVYGGLTTATNKLFAASGTAIYDASPGGLVSAAVTGLSNARWQWVNHRTSGGQFLFIVNGADDPRHYNGTVWATPSITGITATSIINVASHKKRLWFVLKDSLNAAYLGTDAVAGAATVFALGAVFKKGGHLVAITSWTKDGGEGSDDFFVAITSKGQVAVYAGTDPASDTTWALVGVYDLGAPLGYRCFYRVAGDVALLNIDGVLPLSQALQTDRAAAPLIAITADINDDMNVAARSYSGNFGWEMIGYPRGTLAILNVPIQEGIAQMQFVMNTLNGAWCTFSGWNANCFAIYNEALYFGGNSGSINLADTGSLDGAESVDAIGQTAYSYFGSKGRIKHFKMIRPLITTDSAVQPSIGLSTDFKDNATVSTPQVAAQEGALYDEAVWDEDIYPAESRTSAQWIGVEGIGHAASIHFRAQTGDSSAIGLWGLQNWGQAAWSTALPGDVVVRVNSFDLLHERGEVL